MKVGSFCTGYGGLDLAIEQHFGAEMVWYSEVNKHCTKVIERHWPGVPNLGDLTKIDFTKIEPVDIICAGYPCQPFSTAGQRLGEEDDRAIFQYIASAISILRPGVIILENVAGHLTLGGTSVIGSLTELGYDCRWGVVRASDTGAPHKRARWFCLAWDTKVSNGRPPKHSSLDQGNRSAKLGESDRESTTPDTSSERHGGRENNRGVGGMGGQTEIFNREGSTSWKEPQHRSSKTSTDPNSERLQGPRQERELAEGNGPEHTPRNADDNNGEREATTNPDNSRCESSRTEYRLAETTDGTLPICEFGAYGPAIRRWEKITGRLAPYPVDDRGVEPRFVEFMMGLPDGWVTESELGSRSAELRMLGNGVVPQQALLALALLTNGMNMAEK